MLNRLIQLINESPVVRLFAALEPIGLAIGVIGLLVTSYAFLADLSDRREERIARAWQLLSTPSPGNFGKSEALNTLFSYDVNLSNIDLSCGSVGGTIKGFSEDFYYFAVTTDKSEGVRSACNSPVNLFNVELGQKVTSFFGFFKRYDSLIASDLDFEGIQAEGFNVFGGNISNSNLSHANILLLEAREATAVDIIAQYADIAGADFNLAQLDGAKFQRANLAYADLSKASGSCIDFAGANLEGIDFTKSNIGSSNFFAARLAAAKLSKPLLEHSDIRYANLSGSVLPNISLDEFALFDNNWAWADDPPKPLGIATQLKIALCDPVDREEYLEAFSSFGPVNSDLLPLSCDVDQDVITAENKMPNVPEICGGY